MNCASNSASSWMTLYVLINAGIIFLEMVCPKLTCVFLTPFGDNADNREGNHKERKTLGRGRSIRGRRSNIQNRGSSQQVLLVVYAMNLV